MSEAISDAARPRLARGVRLKHDAVRGEWLLLAPERIVKANPVAVEILKRCTGEGSPEAMIDELAEIYTADRATIARDVHALLADLAAKGMVEL